MIDKETYIAMAMYGAYTDAVGGKAFNGDPLPTAEELFTDSSKAKIVNAWKAAARAAINEVENW